jgi:hypothetical protein
MIPNFNHKSSSILIALILGIAFIFSPQHHGCKGFGVPSVRVKGFGRTASKSSSSSLQAVASHKAVSSTSVITQEEILVAQKSWGDGLVLISKTYEEEGYASAKKAAKKILDSVYGYSKDIPVLFKPTLSSGEQTFRLTHEGALSYYVGGYAKYPNDTGFANRGWREVKSYPVGILLLGNTAFSIGKVHCIDKNGNCTVVEKSWGYKKDNEGNIRIILHHSSLPYSP